MSNFLDSLIVSMLMDERSDLRHLRNEKDVREVLDIIFASSSSSGSSEDSESENEQPRKSANFEATLDAMSDSEFKLRTKLKRETVDYLILRYSQSDCVPNISGGGRLRVGFKKAIYMYIWYVSNAVPFRELSNLFGVAGSAAWATVRRVTGFLISISHEFIKWPTGAYLSENIQKFEQKHQIPGVIGVIDCTHIKIKPLQVQRDLYLNREKTHTLVLQAVVDANKKFIDLTCGEPGSLQDNIILKRSQLFRRAETNLDVMFPNSCFVIANSTYPSTNWLVPSYRDDGNLTVTQQKFNEIHASTRVVAKNAFALLKSRFQRLLKFTELADLKMVTNVVASTCVLHNICISMDDLFEFNETNGELALVSEEHIPLAEELLQETPLDRRLSLFHNLKRQNIV